MLKGMNIPEGSILVGYDGSGDSEHALSWAEEMARRTNRPLQVLISKVDPAQVFAFAVEWHQEMIERIESDARDRLKESKAPGVSIDVVAAPPVEALVEASSHASLVVVGARGHSPLSGVLLGSVSQHVSQHAACPVVVVRPPSNPLDRVVVGVDGSAGSSAALEFAAEHASRTGAALTVIYAWRSLSRGRGSLMGPPFDSQFDEERKEADRILSEAVAGLGERYPDVKLTTEAIPVAPSRCLADASELASLVVVGSRGRGAFAGMLLGSTSQSVLRHARCSVAIVR